MARLVAIARERSDAEEVARRGVAWLTGSYAKATDPQQASDLRSHQARRAGEDSLLEGDTTERYLAEAVLWGTPDEVTDQILELQERIPLYYLLAAPLSHETFVLLTDEVLPRVC